MKKIITIIFAIAIFQIPTIFAQTFVENRYFYENNSSDKSTGFYENKLLFIHDANLYLIDGENTPYILSDASFFGIEDNFKRNSAAGWAKEFSIDDENNIIDGTEYDNIGQHKDIAKDQNDNIYFVDSDGKLFAYDESGNHTELYVMDNESFFTGLTTNSDYVISSQYTNEGSMITKIPKVGGENIVFNYTNLGVSEPVTVKFSDNSLETLLLKQDENTYVCKVGNDGNLTNLFEINELTGRIKMSASIDENDNYHVLVTGQNGSLEIIYEEETNNIQNIQDAQIYVFPNSTNGIINIETVEQIEKITILDISGKTIIETTNTEIDLTKQKTGTYFVKIETSSGILTEKIVVE